VCGPDILQHITQNGPATIGGCTLGSCSTITEVSAYPGCLNTPILPVCPNRKAISNAAFFSVDDGDYTCRNKYEGTAVRSGFAPPYGRYMNSLSFTAAAMFADASLEIPATTASSHYRLI
jgi:hypothetical protein